MELQRKAKHSINLLTGAHGIFNVLNQRIREIQDLNRDELLEFSEIYGKGKAFEECAHSVFERALNLPDSENNLKSVLFTLSSEYSENATKEFNTLIDMFTSILNLST